MKLGFDDVLQFGKHKGKSVLALLDEDPSYLAWFRDDNRKKKVLEVFNNDVNAHLDNIIAANPYLRKKFPIGKPIPTVPPLREATYSNDWGAW